MTDQQKNELVITRVFNAPVELVWNMWTKADLIKKWWGPQMFSCPSASIDFKVGGKYLYCMRGKAGLPPEMEGKDFWSTGVYKEIIPLRKIVVLDSFSDEDGNIVPPSHYGMTDLPLEMQVTTEFEDIGDSKTKITLRHAGIAHANPEMIKNMAQGWEESFDKVSDNL